MEIGLKSGPIQRIFNRLRHCLPPPLIGPAADSSLWFLFRKFLEAAMRLDPRLIHDVLHVEHDGKSAPTAQQWLGLPSGEVPEKRELQQAYQGQLARLKAARDQFDSDQLKLAAKKLKAAAIELKDAKVSANHPTPAPAPKAAPVARPVGQSPPMAKPIAATNASPPKADSESGAIPVAIDTNRRVTRKRKRGNALFTWVVLLTLVGTVAGLLFALVQWQLIDLEALMGRPAKMAQNLEPPINDPATRTDQVTADDPEPIPTSQDDASASDDEVPENTDSDPRVSPNSRQENTAALVVGRNEPSPNGAEQRNNGSTNSSASTTDTDPATTDRSPFDPFAFQIVMDDLDDAACRELCYRFEVCLACLATGDAETLASHQSKLESLGPAASAASAIIQDALAADQQFQQMFRKRLPLVQRVGEIETGDTYISVISLKPNDYRFRINGANRTFTDKDLPLGLRLSMFNAVDPANPADDVCLHVYQCLPYLGGNPALRESLLERLASTREMEPGNLFDPATVDNLETLVGAHGSVAQWLSQHYPSRIASWREAESTETPSQSLRVPEGKVATAWQQSLVSSSLQDWDARRRGAIKAAQNHNEIPLVADLIREHQVWYSQTARSLGSGWPRKLAQHSQASTSWEDWLEQLETELRNDHNDPTLDRLLMETGKQLANRFAGNQKRRWSNRLDSAARRNQ